MILIDRMGHMVSTENAEELHAFAGKLGLKRIWYQAPGYGEKYSHYDLTTGRMRSKASRLGAKMVTPKELVKAAWWQKGAGSGLHT